MALPGVHSTRRDSDPQPHGRRTCIEGWRRGHGTQVRIADLDPRDPLRSREPYTKTGLPNESATDVVYGETDAHQCRPQQKAIGRSELRTNLPRENES